MKISDTTVDFIQDLKQFSSGKLKHPDDISFLYEITTITKQEKLFKEIIFTAKYLNGLGKILHDSPEPRHERSSTSQRLGGVVDRMGSRRTIDDSALDKIKTEFKDNLQKLTSQIKTLIDSTAANERSDFGKKYFSLTQESLVNLTNLIYDLSWVKKYWNMKR